MDKRKELRFPVLLDVGVREPDKKSVVGVTKDFSRYGLRAIFDDFQSNPDSCVALKIQNPNQSTFTLARAEVKWKRPNKEKWEVGFRLKELAPQVKAEILEYSYKEWLKYRVCAA